MTKNPPEIPTIAAAGLSDLQEAIAKIVKRLDQVPFDKIGADLKRALEQLNVTLRKADALVAQMNDEVAPELKSTIEQARKTLAAAERTVAPDSPVQDDLRETLQEVTRAAESMRQLVDYLERHPESLLRGKRGERK
jgi:paraquat-inducible protein B